MEHENKSVMAEAIKEVLCYRVSMYKLIFLSREPAVVAHYLRELTVSAHPGKLRRPLEAGAHQF
jgi:hypothetical protein